MNILAIIPARGGSKGIPGKNTRNCAGRPLIAWSIAQALDCDGIDRVIVSTDSKEIADIAKKWGAEVPFSRPDILAQDETATEPVLIHVLDELEKTGYVPDGVMLLQPTSPIRKPRRLMEAIELFEKDQADSLLSVCPTHPFFWQNTNNPVSLYNIDKRPRRQDVPLEQEMFRENGSIYITKTSLLRESSNRLGGAISMLEMDEEESHDIDSLTDFNIVETLLRILNTVGTISRTDVDAILFDFDGVLTNNLVYCSQDGIEAVTCNRSDGLGFDMMRDLQIPNFIISKEKNPVVSARAKKLKVPVMQNVDDKAQAVMSLAEEYDFDLSRIMFVGNDVNDLTAMDLVGYPIAVADAHHSVKEASVRVLDQPGGGMVAREIMESIFGISAADWARQQQSKI
ncbi:MAG: acylneuraminate cytidylyltransferase [Rhodospirillales bacterium]|nr:acylneuraminate cytidylyltransferase [Rhodospirillales bacterium]